MEAHHSPPAAATLADLARAITTTTDTAVTAAGRLHGDGDGEGLDAAAVLLAAIDRLTAAVITVLQASDHDRVIVAHGVTRDTWLRAVGGRTGADAGMLLAAAERLGDMPAVSAWFHSGVLSWGAVRQIVAVTRNLTAAQRAWVDTTLAAGDRIEALDGDQVVAAVEGLADRARPDLARARDAAVLTRRWLTIQPRLDGTADIHGSLDPETAAAALAAFAATPRDHHATTDDHGGDHGDGDDDLSDADVVRAARLRSNVDIFGDLCRQRVTRHGHHHGAADATADAGDAAGDAAGAGPAAAVSAGDVGSAGRRRRPRGRRCWSSPTCRCWMRTRRWGRAPPVAPGHHPRAGRAHPRGGTAAGV